MDIKHISNIAVVGAGLMGHGIAQCLALKGFEVHLYDAFPAVLEEAPKKIRENLKVFLVEGLITPQEVEAGLSRLRLFHDLAQACSGAQVIIESVPEDLALKQQVFAQMEAAGSPEAVLASNTSGLPITQISQNLKDPSRVVGMHFWNPPHVVPCVEVIKGARTSDEVFELAVKLVQALDKEPVRVLKDLPGFLGNRIQMAIMREAVALLQEGVAAPEDIDKVVKYSFGMRMPFIGPFEVMDLAGHEMGLAVMTHLMPQISRETKPFKIVSDLVAQGHLGVRTGQGIYSWTPEKSRALIEQRDRGLLALIKLRKEAVGHE